MQNIIALDHRNNNVVEIQKQENNNLAILFAIYQQVKYFQHFQKVHIINY